MGPGPRPRRAPGGELAVATSPDHAAGQGLTRLGDHLGRQLLDRGKPMSPEAVAIDLLAIQRKHHRQGQCPVGPTRWTQHDAADQPLMRPMHHRFECVADRCVFEVAGVGHVFAVATTSGAVENQFDRRVFPVALSIDHRHDHMLQQQLTEPWQRPDRSIEEPFVNGPMLGDMAQQTAGDRANQIGHRGLGATKYPAGGAFPKYG